MEIYFSLLDPDLGEKMNADPYGSAAQQLRFIYLVDQLGLLVGGAKLEELLDDVIAKDVGHEGVGVRQDFLNRAGQSLSDRVQRECGSPDL